MDMRQLKEIDSAKGFEKEMYFFYAEHSKKQYSPEVKELFLKLAVAELRHVRVLEAFVQLENFELAKDLAYRENIMETTDGIRGDKLFFQNSDSIIAVFNIAINNEEKAYEGYKKYFLEEKNGQIKILFEHFMNWELEHKEMLEREIEKIKNQN